MLVWVGMVKTRTEEKILKSAWHALIALVGLYELRNQKSKASKVLACGLIAFHADAAVCDALDKPTTLQRWVRRLRPCCELPGRPSASVLGKSSKRKAITEKTLLKPSARRTQNLPK